MARQLHMSWISSTRRWMKMFHGKRYVISCRQLGVQETKDGSWRAANAWWDAKRAELEAAAKPPAHQLTEKIVDALDEGAGGELMDQMNKGMAAQALMLAIHSAVGRPLTTAADIEEAGKEIAEKVREGQLPSDLFARFESPFLRTDWGKRFNLLFEGAKVPVDRTVAGQVKRWIATQQALVGAGKITPDRADNNRICLLHFRDFLGSGSPLEAINEESIHNFFLHCLGKVEAGKNGKKKEKTTVNATQQCEPANAVAENQHGPRDTVSAAASWSIDYAKMVFRISRTFVRFLWESRLIELPRNIDSRSSRFGSGTKSVPTWTVDEFKMVFGKATGQLRLHLLLMANCGMCQTDISDLLDKEVDWKQGAHHSQAVENRRRRECSRR